MRLLTWCSDLSGCFTYRIQIPFGELKRYGVTTTTLPEVPNNPWGNDFAELCRLVSQHDLTVVQRCYKHDVVKVIHNACEVMGKKMIFETDDDYFNLPRSNPCYPEMARPGVLQGYAEILKMADLITVSTKELRDTLYRFNRNIVVLPNNVENVFCGTEGKPIRTYGRETVDENGKVQIPNYFGMAICPSYWEDKRGQRHRTVRIGYTGTPSHVEDFETIRYSLERVLERNHAKLWMIFIGDKYFYDKMTAAKHRMIHIPASQFSLYQYQLRNLDIGLAPLVPNLFNMSKSPVKALEYSTWGTASLLPNYVTYTRDFTDGLNCLTYNNSREFEEKLELLINDQDLREGLGENARDYVLNNRLESLHAEKRYQAYQSLLNGRGGMKCFYPKEMNV